MAGGKLTPRQKMINLMYLVFIAMLALNMSKEVLSAFGLFNEKFEKSNIAAVQTNEAILQTLSQKASEDPKNFEGPKQIADKVTNLTKAFYNYIGELKAGITEGVDVDEKTGKLPYEAMDKADAIDYTWFKGDGYTEKGNEVLATINKYRDDVKAAVGNDKKYKAIVADLDSKFNTEDVKNKDGITIPFLDYHYRGFPGIASLTKLSAMQSDAKAIESSVLNALIGNTYETTASYSNYQAIVVLDKNAYFQGETVTGKVVLGRYDSNTTPTKFVGPGKIENGQAVISLTAGSVGEQNINGQFVFVEDGKEIPLKFEGKYVVVPQPKEATISADKMNVVYRGVVNPMTISFAGVSDSDVSASGPGLTRATGTGKYNMSPGQGSEAIISVTAKLPGGKTASSKKAFRIKGIPAPQGTVRGELGLVKGPKSSLEVSTVGAKLVDFDFEVKIDVVGFNIKVTGQPTVVVQGSKMNAQAVSAIQRAGRGDQITISEIKTRLVGADNYMLPKTSPVIYEVQ